MNLICRQCGSSFVRRDPRGVPPVYCSKRCSSRYQAARRRDGVGHKPCAVDGCTRMVKAGGAYCAMHQARLKRTGSLGPPNPVIHRVRGTIEEELLNNRIITETGCWRWTLRHHYSGYGVLTKNNFVHRIAYELWVGPIPEGLELDHVRARGCVHKDCFNPTHLEAVTHAENMRRTRGIPRKRSRWDKADAGG